VTGPLAAADVLVVFDTNALLPLLDAHLLNLKYYHGTQIISLDQFARLLWAEH
jgi:hypothetical protein